MVVMLLITTPSIRVAPRHRFALRHAIDWRCAMPSIRVAPRHRFALRHAIDSWCNASICGRSLRLTGVFDDL
jgi:hypothetical protein